MSSRKSNSPAPAPKTSVMDAKGLHDRLLEQKPPGATHPDDCPMCAMESHTEAGRATASEDPEGGQGVKTYTEDELKAAVDKAVGEATASLRAEVDKLTTAVTETELDAKVKAATADLDGKIADLQGQLDNAVLEAKSEKDKREALEAWLTEEKEKAEQQAEIAARKDERVKAVREVANFPDSYLEANADRFAAMSDEDFEKALADWKAISGPAAVKPPKTTALTAAAEDDTDKGGVNPIKEVLAMRHQGIDPRQISSREA